LKLLQSYTFNFILKSWLILYTPNDLKLSTKLHTFYEFEINLILFFLAKNELLIYWKFYFSYNFIFIPSVQNHFVEQMFYNCFNKYKFNKYISSIVSNQFYYLLIWQLCLLLLEYQILLLTVHIFIMLNYNIDQALSIGML